MRYGERGVSSEIQTVEKELQEKARSKPAVMVGQEKRRRYIRKRVRRIAASLEVNVEIITKGLEASVMAIKKRLIELQERIVARESEAVEND